MLQKFISLILVVTLAPYAYAQETLRASVADPEPIRLLAKDTQQDMLPKPTPCTKSKQLMQYGPMATTFLGLLACVSFCWVAQKYDELLKRDAPDNDPEYQSYERLGWFCWVATATLLMAGTFASLSSPQKIHKLGQFNAPKAPPKLQKQLDQCDRIGRLGQYTALTVAALASIVYFPIYLDRIPVGRSDLCEKVVSWSGLGLATVSLAIGSVAFAIKLILQKGEQKKTLNALDGQGDALTTTNT